MLDTPTPFDIRWRMLGTDITVSPWFWLTLSLLGWGFVEAGGPILLGIWLLAGFLSILLHEFGHVLMGRVFGNRGSILLTAFCGLALGASEGLTPWRRIAVSAAGPGIQLVFWGLLLLFKYQAPEAYLSLPENGQILFDLLVMINLYWAILNLLPIYPLDGGQILCSLLESFMGLKGRYYGHGISFVLATAGALFFLIRGMGGFFAIFLAINAFLNYQLMEQYRDHHRSGDDYPWTR